MIKLGALKDPIFPRKLARERRYAGQDWTSAGGTSAREVGIVGALDLLDIFLVNGRLSRYWDAIA